LQATSGTVSSEAKTVYVLNGAETGSISFASLRAGQTLSGEAEFDIDLTYAPVPFNRLDWTWTSSTGQVVVTRTSPNVGKIMQLAWDTTHWPNGSYTLNITGYAGSKVGATASMAVVVKN
jgi:hypothetical protein